MQPLAECASDDDKLGWFESLEECAKACIREPNCRYFIYGVGSPGTKGYCYMEKPSNPTDGDICSNGWENDYYDFYKVSIIR